MLETQRLADASEIAARIPDGALLALPRDFVGCAMAVTRALIRRRARNLQLLSVPTSSMQADMLIGAGAVSALECAGVSLGEHGPAPCFARAVKAGTIRLRDTTCPAIHAGLQAAEKGVPFLPLRGLIGSDLLRHREDYKVIQNPCAEVEDPIVAVPAITPDVALFHAPLADRAGNVWIGLQRELMTMAHAARQTFVTVEAVVDGDLTADAAMAAGTLPAIYVSGFALAERGAWPLRLPERYAEDAEHIGLYARLARSEAGFQDYLARFVLGSAAAAE